jgi:hypothetical protein
MRKSGRDFDGNGAWVDFNSLDVQGCWVSGGPNVTCPYRDATGEKTANKDILVPTIAAIIVLIITALTVFSKVAGNRQLKRRTKRRPDNGFIYEGVPS